jgi:23S rRNA pseudouridine1911/1915/1917 synthase
VSADPRSLEVTGPESGRRLDLFLAERLQLSRAQVRRLLARGAVSVAGLAVAADAKGRALTPGQEVVVAPFTRPEDQRPVSEPDAPLRILAEGPGWLAVDKPPGVPVHPLEEGETGSLLSAVIARHPEIQGVGEGGLRCGVVHRLDIDTSGVLLFATEEAVWRDLRAAFSEHRVEKTYRAIVVGRLEQEGFAEVGLVTARHRPARVRVVDDEELVRARGARMGELSYHPVEVFDDASLVEVRPRTGHLHQIRVTLAHLGHPVAGDATYGASSDPVGAPRQMLHAARAAWKGGEAESPDAADFCEVLARLREQAGGS